MLGGIHIVDIKWYYDGSLNVSYNCIDRHAKKNPDRTAIIWEGDDPNNIKKITYNELLTNVCRAANVLKKLGVKKGDRVTIYLTMVPELAYMMLACARIGAIHSIIFGGFSAESISGRIIDCKSEFVITADEGVRGGKKIPEKPRHRGNYVKFNQLSFEHTLSSLGNLEPPQKAVTKKTLKKMAFFLTKIVTPLEGSVFNKIDQSCRDMIELIFSYYLLTFLGNFIEN